MDLHIVAPLASPVEREAVDAVITPVVGPPVSGWRGGPRTTAEGTVAHGGHEARSHRDLLLPALRALQARIGYITEPALGYVCRRLAIPPADAYGVATFYALLNTTPQPPAVAHVCDDIACRIAGAEKLCSELEERLGHEGAPARDGHLTWRRSPCLGQCDRAPAALFTFAGREPATFTLAPVDAAGVIARLEDHAAGRTAGRFDGVGLTLQPEASTEPTPARLAALQKAVPQAGDASLRLLSRVGVVDPMSIASYVASGGYNALRTAVERGAQWVLDEVTQPRLLGRGGAAFPTGRKWAAAAVALGEPKYVVCNADESEPSNFKDRVLLEEDPFTIIESMTIAGFASGSQQGYLYIRGEYELAAVRCANAIEQARAAGFLGANVMGAGFAFDIDLRRGAGAYIAGEGSAMLASIEGRRAEPRNKPPRSTEQGLFDKPTLINNVETFANVPWILLEGAEAYAAIGTQRSTGTKLFCVSGHVERPGVYETPFGVTVGEVLAMAGGVRTGHSVQAMLIGGAAGYFVGPDTMDMPLTFEGARARGITLGTASVFVLDETANMLDILRRIAAFMRDESCGQCVPCRVGTVRQEEILARLAAGTPFGSAGNELALLKDLGRVLRDASICGLGQMAGNAVESAIANLGVMKEAVAR